MFEKKTLVTALSGVLIGGLLLSGGMAVAGDAKNSVGENLAGKMPFFGKVMGHRGGMMGNKGYFGVAGPKLSLQTLSQLVTDGVITQEKLEEIKAFIDKTDQEGTTLRGKQDLFAGLVKNNILTQEQADTIKTKLKELAQKQKQQQLSDTLKTLVEKGTITQEQSDKILKRFEDNKGKSQNPIDQLVSEGVITQEQVDAIQETMRETAQKQNQQRISDSLKTIVDKGTITQEQADKILTKLESIHKDREALFDKVKNMTPEERRQYKEDNKGNPQNPIDQLVTDGTITQDQAKAIQEIFPSHQGLKRGWR